MARAISSQTIADYVTGRLDARCMVLVAAAGRDSRPVAQAISEARRVRARAEARLTRTHLTRTPMDCEAR